MARGGSERASEAGHFNPRMSLWGQKRTARQERRKNARFRASGQNVERAHRMGLRLRALCVFNKLHNNLIR